MKKTLSQSSSSIILSAGTYGEGVEVVLVAHAHRQAHVKVALLLAKWEVVLAVEGECVNVGMVFKYKRRSISL